MHELDFISRHFLTVLFDIMQYTLPRLLRVVHPEGSESFDMSKAIVTYSPKHNSVVMHFGTKTVQLHLTNWKEMHSPAPGEVLYMKDDVVYSFEPTTESNKESIEADKEWSRHQPHTAQ